MGLEAASSAAFLTAVLVLVLAGTPPSALASREYRYFLFLFLYWIGGNKNFLRNDDDNDGGCDNQSGGKTIRTRRVSN